MTLCLAVLLTASFFVACNLISSNSDKDMALIVATVTVEKQQNDNSKILAKQTINIYKQDLVSALSSNSEPDEEAVNSSLDGIIDNEITFANIVKQLIFGEIEWMPYRDENGDIVPKYTKDEQGNLIPNPDLYIDEQGNAINLQNNTQALLDYTNYNKILRDIYTKIDDRLFEIANVILTERNEENIPKPSTSSESPTFPVPSTPIDKATMREERYYPISYPGDSDNGTSDDSDSNKMASLQREAFRRYIAELETAIQDNYRASDSTKKKYQQQIKNIRDIFTNTNKIEYPYVDTNTNDKYDSPYQRAYLQIGDDIFTAIQEGLDKGIIEAGQDSIVWYDISKSVFRSTVQTLWQDNLKEIAKDNFNSDYRAEQRILNYYDEMLAYQKRTYTSSDDESEFQKAGDEEDSLLLYSPDSRLYWVKHILIQFNDEESAILKQIQANALSQEDYLQQRKTLVDKMITHPIINGEEDTSVNMTVKQVENEILSTLEQAKGSIHESQKAMNTLIYKYNRDTGLAEKLSRGYQVKPEVNPSDPSLQGIDKNYMREFSQAAKNLYDRFIDSGLNNDIGLGEMEYAITDYGAHFVYLSDVTRGNTTLKLNDFTTSAQSETVYENIKNKLISLDEGNAYTTWLNQMLAESQTNKNTSIQKINKNYKNLWKN